MLDVRRIDVAYGAIAALHDVSLSVESGEVVSVLGANGAGKTTLLRTISGLMRARGGSIEFDGLRIDQLSTSRIVGAGIAHVPEGRGILTELTVQENLRIGAYTRRDSGNIESDVARCYDIFPILRKRLRQSAGLLSGGEQQMLAIARALLCRPKLVMIDEMSLGLAPLLVSSILETIRGLAANGTSFLLVEQNAKLALRHSDRAYVLRNGKVSVAGRSSEILSDSALLNAYLG
jgi:branched-chain amino acid transport system ATP-binding protein